MNITDTEQAIMRIIWTKKQATGREIITEAQLSHDWSSSTIKTLIRRLTDKGMITVDKSKSVFTYLPAVSENDATDDQAKRLFESVCDAYKGTLLTELIQSEPLSQSDIVKMQEILANRAKTAPKQVDCHCLHEDMDEACAMHAH
ncbi:copper transport repressor, CopY/TcrY family [Fructobacillus pseudoficulneus]|uniref:Copper transport repressor, CopY/TcrY family n=1 Tax=Fructobacillus pseudoficulneus TaxID=220714 RepID=A0A3F3HBS4_9LACO|nr:CopY/TcrY family copper transport repressor [Fructobacillus pseudoficulneus]GAP03403.1 copper transport repressor, CopY/TcrY family [Fructobacillus pseudoficulneus]SEH46278.1 copper transport repressor, CopY/TcrY family [Fructobacillus pseudoficulneus]